MVSRLLDLAFAIALSLTIANVAQMRAIGSPHVRDSATLGRDQAASPDFPLVQIDARRHPLSL